MLLRDLPTRGLSPYLREHTDNPVDWYPLGDEAFEEARRRDVPVFLSVGYSSCHWCPVTAHKARVRSVAAAAGVAATMTTMAVLTDVATVSENTFSTASSF